jgi:hypothetical protein
MTLRTILALGVTTLAIGTSAGAFATEASAYRYGMNLTSLRWSPSRRPPRLRATPAPPS